MEHKLPELPYAKDALEPSISRETLEYHYGKHHAGYVKKLNAALEDYAHAAYRDMTLEELICHVDPATTAIFNNAAQTWNHTFYWNCMTPETSTKPDGALAKVIDDTFGSLTNLKKEFVTAAKGQFGSGWAWLVTEADGSLSITTTGNADNPLRDGLTPLLVCDVWEHAYYIDYRNARGDYLDAFWRVANWAHANVQYNEARARKAA